MRILKVFAVATLLIAGCKNPVVTSIKSDGLAPVTPPGAPDSETVSQDFLAYIMKWSTKSECVITEPQPSPELNKFRCARRDNWDKFCQAFVDGGRGADGVRAMCKKAEFFFGAADGNSCEYGHCGEASAVFGCQAVERGIPLEQVQICKTDNDHIFAMVQQKSGTFCILDRWTVSFKPEIPKPIGNVICGVQIINGRVAVGANLSNNTWYSELSCKPVVEHYAERCPEPAAPNPPGQEPDDPTMQDDQ